MDVAGREDFAEALVLIDAKLAAPEAAGVEPAGQTNWRALPERQAGLAAQISAAISGTGDAGRFSPEQAAQIAEDVARKSATPIAELALRQGWISTAGIWLVSLLTGLNGALVQIIMSSRGAEETGTELVRCYPPTHLYTAPGDVVHDVHHPRSSPIPLFDYSGSAYERDHSFGVRGRESGVVANQKE